MGIIAETYCNIFGIDSIGNIIPDSITMGMSNNMADMSKAANWVLAMLETSRPNDNANKM